VLPVGRHCNPRRYGGITATTLGFASAAAAAPSGFGNAEDTINALQSQGFNVILNGAAVYPLSGCKVTGIEGLNSSNHPGKSCSAGPGRLYEWHR
jgi:hypothetical protein